MRSKDTVAVTITLPRATYESVCEMARQRECGNVSAVIRKVLYKESGFTLPEPMNDAQAKEVVAAEARTVKYSGKGKRRGGSGKAGK